MEQSHFNAQIASALRGCLTHELFVRHEIERFCTQLNLIKKSNVSLFLRVFVKTAKITSKE